MNPKISAGENRLMDVGVWVLGEATTSCLNIIGSSGCYQPS
jgi:hypothetical protein